MIIKIIECGCCGHFHKLSYHGDCRDDSERFDSLTSAAERIGEDCQEVDEEGCIDPFVYHPSGKISANNS